MGLSLEGYCTRLTPFKNRNKNKEAKKYADTFSDHFNPCHGE
jgi:hypothetical protein